MNAHVRVELHSTLVHRGVENKFSNYPSACCRQVGGGVSVRGIVSVVVPACCRRCFTLHHPDWKHIQYRSVQIVEGFFWNVTHLHMNGWEHTHFSIWLDAGVTGRLVFLPSCRGCRLHNTWRSLATPEAFCVRLWGFSSRTFSVQFVLFLQSRFCGSCTKPHQIKILALFLNEIESWVARPEDLGELEIFLFTSTRLHLRVYSLLVSKFLSEDFSSAQTSLIFSA